MATLRSGSTRTVCAPRSPCCSTLPVFTPWHDVCTAAGPVTPPIIIEARSDRVLVVCGPYGGTGRTVGEAMDALARRMGRTTAPADGLMANQFNRATDEA